MAWRFFGPDPVPFESSLRVDFGSRADRTETVLYYYKVPGSAAASLWAPDAWQIVAPFRCRDFSEFDADNTEEELERAPFQATVAATRGWVDVRHPLRGGSEHWSELADEYLSRDPSRRADGDRYPAGFSVYARASLTSDAETDAVLRLAFDDWLSLWVNGRKLATLRHDSGFAVARVRVSLRRGENELQIKLNNTDNREYRLWAFHCAVET